MSSVYSSLFEEEYSGIYLLRNTLLEYSDLPRTQVIMARIDVLYNRYRDQFQDQPAFTPIFKFFKTSEDDMKIVMYRQIIKDANVDYGTVYLNLKKGESGFDLIELDINFVTEEEGNTKTDLTVPEAMAYLKVHFQHFAYHNKRNIISDMLAYQALDNLQSGIYTFDIFINVNEVRITVKKFDQEIKKVVFEIP